MFLSISWGLIIGIITFVIESMKILFKCAG